MSDFAHKTTSGTMPGHLIRRLHQVSTRVFLARMKAAGLELTPIQFAAMDAINKIPDMDQAQLAKTIGKDKATIGAVADRLAQKGLVSRARSAKDKRARVLRLTKSGADLVAQAQPIVNALQREILPGLTPAEFDQFVALAAKATHAAEAMLEV